MTHSDLTQLLHELQSRNIQLQVDGDRLKLNAPKAALTPELRERLTRHKADIIRFHQARQAHAGKADIPALGQQQPQPCSFAQQRLWLLEQLEPGSHAYTIPVFLRALGTLQLPALQQAIDAILRRHASLRTVFREPQGENQAPLQVVLPPTALEMPVTDLSQLPEQEAEARIHTLAATAVKTPFDLAQGPLLRLHILKVSTQQHVLLLTLHHLIFDGLSLDIFLRELGVLYRAFSLQQPASLPELAIQYSDFSVWQRERLSGPYLQEQLTFWRQELEGAPPVLGLPTDHPRPTLQGYAGARQSLEIDTDTTCKLRTLSQQQGVTLFMTFHALLAILLARYTGKDDIVMGAPIANRNHQQLENLIGFFANTMVLRTTVQPEASFQELLTQIKNRALQAYKYQELPFEKLVDELKIERSLSHNPLFQVLFSFQNAHTEGFSLPGVDILPLAFDYTVSKFDLSIIVREYREKFTVILEYSTDLFEAGTIKRMLGHVQMLIQSAIQQPHKPIGHWNLLTQAEVRQLQAWNATTVDYPQDKTLVDSFEQQVKLTPDSVAVVYGAQQLTYQELNRQANQIAHHLLGHNVGAGTLVGLCLERSLETPAAILAILKAGAAYVPLDPHYPPERLAFMVNDSQMRLLLTQQTLLEYLPVLQTPLICLDSDWQAISRQPTQSPAIQAEPGEPAYMIYTSGSTGLPKGVLISHRNLMHSTTARLRYYADSPLQRFLLLSSLAFDSSVAGIFWALGSGGTLVLPPPGAEKEVDTLTRLIAQNRVTHILLLPSLYQLMLQHAAPQLATLQSVIVAGEPCPPTLPRQHHQHLPQAHLYNEYGPTEGSVWSSVFRFPVGWQGAQAPIGSPIGNVQLYALDACRQPVPIGVAGELYIGGEGIAAGYWRRPELDAEKFVPNPFGSGRLYRTGDQVRWQEDGNLVFLGRIDQQVKLRGFRLELSEIEAVLSQQTGIQEAVAALHGQQNQQSLVAYITLAPTPEHGTDFSSSTLRRELQAKLPDYMVPAFFVVLEAFPLLPNGKINRQALPEPDRFSNQSRAYMHPRNSLELQLCQIWEKTLNLSPISVFDDFFDIGGDSLLAIRLTSRVNQHFGAQIALNTLFRSHTIEQLALFLRSDAAIVTQNSPLVPLQPHGAKLPIFCVHAAGGIVFRYMQLAKLISVQYGHPFYGLQAKGIEPGETPYTSIETMAQHYVAAIRQARPQGPYLLAGWSMGGTVAFAMARLLENMGETVVGVIMIDAPSPYIDAYETDDVDFLLERLEPAAGINIQEEVARQDSEQAQKQLIIEQKKQIGLLPPDITLEEAEQRLRVHKHHNRLLCHYRPTAVIDAGIAFIKATEETRFDEKMKNPIPAWAELTRSGIIERESPGNHFNMFSNKHSPILAEKLHECLQALGI